MSISVFRSGRQKNFTAVLTGNSKRKDDLFLSLAGAKKESDNYDYGFYKYRLSEFKIINLPAVDSIIFSDGKNEYTKNYFCLNSPGAAIAAVDSLGERDLMLAAEFSQNVKNTIIFVCTNKKIDKHSVKRISETFEVPIILGGNIKALKKQILKFSKNPSETSIHADYGGETELGIASLENALTYFSNKRLAALRLICGGKKLVNSMSQSIGFDLLDDEKFLRALAKQWENSDETGFQKKILKSLERNCKKALGHHR